jgi:hypothetical protein
MRTAMRKCAEQRQWSSRKGDESNADAFHRARRVLDTLLKYYAPTKDAVVPLVELFQSNAFASTVFVDFGRGGEIERWVKLLFGERHESAAAHWLDEWQELVDIDPSAGASNACTFSHAMYWLMEKACTFILHAKGETGFLKLFVHTLEAWGSNSDKGEISYLFYYMAKEICDRYDATPGIEPDRVNVLRNELAVIANTLYVRCLLGIKAYDWHPYKTELNHTEDALELFFSCMTDPASIDKTESEFALALHIRPYFRESLPTFAVGVARRLLYLQVFSRDFDMHDESKDGALFNAMLQQFANQVPDDPGLRWDNPEGADWQAEVLAAATARPVDSPADRHGRRRCRRRHGHGH